MSKEAPFRAGVDRFFRREDTFLAKALKKTCSLEGQEYRNSRFKRRTEILMAAPAAVLTAPIVGGLALAAKLEDGGSGFYRQERLDGDGEGLLLVKVRCMQEGADNDDEASLMNAITYGEARDPRNTRLGSFMRQFELEELPQLWQVLKGRISLIDIRTLAPYAIRFIKRERPRSFEEWWQAYLSGRPGLFSLNAAVNRVRKDDRRRHHLDMLYAKKASLGLDLFILYKTGVRMWSRLRQVVGSKLPQRLKKQGSSSVL